MDIVGNPKTIKLLERIVDSGRIVSAYLFVGPEGVGKLAAALFFAKKIVNNRKKIDSNLIMVEPETEEKNGIVKKRDIRIEAIRQLQHQLSLTATGGEYKAVIINEAERLNTTAQNALLKTLEEPNEKVVVVLITQNEKKILPTMVSRCQKIKFGPVDDGAISKNLPDNIANREEIILWSAGRSAVAQKLASDSQELDYRREVRKDFLAAVGDGVKEKFSLAEKWSKDGNDLPRKMDVCLIILRQAMLGKIQIGKISPSRALEIAEEMARDMENIKQTNASCKLILENLFLKI